LQAVDEAHRSRMAETEDVAEALDAQDLVVRRRGQRRRCTRAVLDRQARAFGEPIAERRSEGADDVRRAFSMHHAHGIGRAAAR
jgi:hypothetical protein